MSERLKRQIDGLLDEVEAAVSQLDWQVVRDRTQVVLALDPENADAATYLAAAERALSASESIQQPLSNDTPNAPPSPSSRELPGSFSNGRYEVQRLLGEGGKKRVYLPGLGYSPGPGSGLCPDQD